MPKGEFSTPGPFTRTDAAGNQNSAFIFDMRSGWVKLRLPRHIDDAEASELVGLLNKGTHFERLRDALEFMSIKAVEEGWLGDAVPDEELEIALHRARAALDACRSPEAEAAEAQADAGMAAYRERKGDG